MFGRHATEVLVVGAGPVGLMTALLLARRGIKVEIADEEWRTAAHSYALALHPATLKLLDEVGLTAELLRQGNRISSVVFYDGPTPRAELKLAQLSVAFPFVLVLRQNVLEDLLEHRLKHEKIHVRWNHRVSELQTRGERVVATIEELGKFTRGYAVATTEWSVEKTSRTEADFVVGADGYRSVVRRATEIDYPGVGEAETFAVFEFDTDARPEHQMQVVLHEDTTDVLWPLSAGHCRWSFQLRDSDVPPESRTKSRLAVQIGERAFPHLGQEDLRRLLTERAPWFKGRIGEIHWAMAVRFERRLASSFGHGRLWLAGDAAHLTGPVGAQSMNVGLREAHELGWRLSRMLREQAPADLMADYNAQRMEEWQALLGVESRLAAEARAEPWVQQYGARLLPCIPASGEELSMLLAQLGLRLAAATP